MPRPVSPNRSTQQRQHNARSYLRKLLKAGRLDQARAYAAATGLALEQVPTGGAGVAPAARPENPIRSTPLPENLPLKGSVPDMPGQPTGQLAAFLGQPPASPTVFTDSTGASTFTYDYNLSVPVKADSAHFPAFRVSEITVERRKLAGMWQAFTARLRRNGASSVLAWEEVERLEVELGGVVLPEDIPAQVVRTVCTPREPELGHDDPVGTVKGEVVKCPQNNRMRLCALPGVPQAVVWVHGSFPQKVGLPVWAMPNDEDERGGWMLVGQYDRRGVRVR